MKKERRLSRKTLCWMLLLVILNGILACSVGITFLSYVGKNQDSKHQDSIQGMTENSNFISNQLYRYLLQQQETISYLVSYIDEVNLDLQETEVYLQHIKNISGSFSIIECDTYTGYQVNKNTSTSTFVNYTNNSIIKDICDDILNDSDTDQELLMTDAYTDAVRNEDVVAFYQPLIINEKQMLLLYTMNLKTIISSGLNGISGEEKNGFLINSSGEFLLKQSIPGKDIPGDNYFDYIRENSGNEIADQVCEQLKENDSGNYIVADQSGKEWVYVFSKINKTNDWIYIYTQQDNRENMTSEAIHAIIIIVLLMALIIVLDGSIMLWQNKKLKWSLYLNQDINQELQSANESKDQFLSNISHEIRTPINAILGMDEMILRESTEDSVKTYALDIKNAGKTLLAIVNDLLDFNKIRSGKLVLTCVEYEIGSVVNDLLNMIEFRTQEKGLEFHLNMNETIPHLLYGDELRIKQIILNILTNAVKYTEKGSITFSLDYIKLDSDKIGLKVSVKDTGIGMKAEEMDKLFKPFERLDVERNRTIEGTGLGMSIVMMLLKQMDSELMVKSVYGEGSEFSFCLEQKVADWKMAGNLEQLYKETFQNKTDELILKAENASVLVVDDTPVNLVVVKGLLKRTLMQVDTAESGKECLRMLSEKKYDVILLDHRMPEMDGIETLHKIKEMDSQNKETPVIALTANAMAGADEMYRKEGFTDFLSKPVNGKHLEKMIEKYLPDDLCEWVDANKDSKEIQTDYGEKTCGSLELYHEAIEIFIQSADAQMEAIQLAVENKDIDSYTIKVHSVKSSARMVGAMELSNLAAYLEQCGEDGKLLEICEQTEKLLTTYQDTVIRLKYIIKNDAMELESNIILDEKEFAEALLAMKEFAEAFDFDQVDEIMTTISGYKIPVLLETCYQNLKNAVLDVDQEKILDIVNKYFGGVYDKE